jgi:DNA-binding CsgD family transcriptional regulator
MQIMGRDAECKRLATLVEDAGAGRGRSLVLRGEAGIGKTALLNHVADNAGRSTVVRATGVEFESELEFAALGELIRPLVGVLDDLAPRDAHVLATLIPRGAGDGEKRSSADRHAVYAATLALLTAAARRQPLLCLVDDAHWVDKASAEALLFTARRLLTDSMLIVFACRDVPEFHAPGVATLDIAGLDERASVELLALDSDLAPLVGTRLAALTMGNPLALLELPRVLALGPTDGVNALVEPLPTTKPLQRAFAAPLLSMSDEQRLALLVCAAAGHAEVDLVARALATLGVDLVALDEGISRGLVQVGARAVTFRHPLVRSAVYSQAGPGERRTAHAALAQACSTPEDADRRAWHLAHGAVGPDEAVASALASTADRARRRGGVIAEAAARERAAELTADRVTRARRLCLAATVWSSAGATHKADNLFDQADALCADDVPRRVDRTVPRSRPGDLFDALVATPDGTVPGDRLAAARVSSTGINASLARWDVAATLDVCTKVMALTSPEGRPHPAFPKGAVRMALAQVLAGLPEGAELARRCVPACERRGGTGVCVELAEVLTYVEDYDAALRLVDRDVDSARADGDVALLTYGLTRRAQLRVRTGRLLAAYADAGEGVALASAMNEPSTVASAKATLAMVASALGRADECVAYAKEAMRLCPDDLDIETRARHAVGLVALAAGCVDDAVTELRRADAMPRDGGVVEPAVVPVAADLVEALLRADQPVEARRVLERLDTAVATTGRRGRRAAALRCHALLARGAAAGVLFAEALQAHADVDEPLERARTLLCLGQWLRRSRRRQEAHQHLAAALEIFESAGARLWADQARRELDVLGPRSLPSPEGPDLSALTAQESRIALAAAQGQTSREIAATALLSVRTVDHHLGNVYRKLGVPSRLALVHQLNITPPTR